MIVYEERWYYYSILGHNHDGYVDEELHQRMRLKKRKIKYAAIL